MSWALGRGLSAAAWALRAALDFAFGWAVRLAKMEAGSTLAPWLRQRRVRDWSLVMTVQDLAVFPERRDPFRDDVVGGAVAAPDDLDAAEAGGHAGALGPVEDHHDLLALARPGEEGGEDRLRVARPRRSAQHSAEIRGVDQPGHRDRFLAYIPPVTRSGRPSRAPSAGRACTRRPRRTPACWRRHR